MCTKKTDQKIVGVCHLLLRPYHEQRRGPNMLWSRQWRRRHSHRRLLSLIIPTSHWNYSIDFGDLLTSCCHRPHHLEGEHKLMWPDSPLAQCISCIYALLDKKHTCDSSVNKEGWQKIYPQCLQGSKGKDSHQERPRWEKAANGTCARTRALGDGDDSADEV